MANRIVNTLINQGEDAEEAQAIYDDLFEECKIHLDNDNMNGIEEELYNLGLEPDYIEDILYAFTAM